MFESLTPAPPDAVLGLSEAFRADPRGDKVNLTVGVYKDESGITPILDCVREARRRVVEQEHSKAYLGIAGDAAFTAAAVRLVFGSDHPAVAAGRVVCAQTPGGTGAVRVAAELLKARLGAGRVWMSDPTWPNHPAIFKAAGLETATYPYFDAEHNRLRLDEMLATFEQIPAGDVVLLHACCHNPTGVDPDEAAWSKIAELLVRRGLFPLVDFAYQGFGSGLTEDAAGVLKLCEKVPEMLLATSYSKNFGLYNERVGALHVLAASEDSAQTVLGHVKGCIRGNYSNPPAHGAAIVQTVLADEGLTSSWHQELAQMRERINGVRHQFAQRLSANSTRDWSFIAGQNGMFSFTGLTPEQVDRLREEFGIYMVRNGRINVAGLTPENLDVVCDAIAAVES